MLIKIETLKERLQAVILNKGEQGHIIDGLEKELDSIDNSYDSLVNFTKKLSDLPLKDNWPYVEPNNLEEIWSESDPNRPLGLISTINLDDSIKRVKSAFLGSICGCILGKPFEAKFDKHKGRYR